MARLKGHESDLLALAEVFRAGDPAVATDDEGYYLRFAVPDELLRDGGGLYNAASVLLRRVNGVARTLSSDVRPVGLTGRFSDETGRHHQVVLADSAEVRGPRQPGPGVGGWGAAPSTASTGSGRPRTRSRPSRCARRTPRAASACARSGGIRRSTSA